MRKSKYFLQALALSVKIKSRLSLFVNGCALFTAFLPMLISLQLAEFTDKVQLLTNKSILLRDVMLAFGMLAFLYVFQAVFQLVQSYYVREDSENIKRYIKEQCMKLVTSIPYKYIENYDDFCERVDFLKTYAGEKTAGSISLIFAWIANLISFVSVIVILSDVNVWIVIALILTCVPAVILSILQKDETYRQRTKWIKEGRLTIHYSEVCRMNDAMKEIRFFDLYPYIKNKWRDLTDGYIKVKRKIIYKHVLFNSIADLLRNGVYIIVVFLTAWEIFENPAKGLGAFMLVLTAAGQLQNITTKLLIQALSIFTDIKYMEDFFGLLEMEKEVSDTCEQGFEKVDIVFENVDFTYPNSTNKALDGLSVTIRQGEKVAIVGLNGSGKSTFVNLLCGFYEPDSGSIRINGIKVSEKLAVVRQSVSVIFQNFCKYQDTLRNNVTISDSQQSSNDDDILELAKKTGADEVILDKEKSLDEMLGLFSEKGNNLSGGQWQKIAITRALYRKNVRVFILDEPTSALDPVSEANIYRNFSELTQDKTTILISHRLGITSVVDRILVFEDGKIVEDGNHEELMKQNGLYARMYDSQARWYQ